MVDPNPNSTAIVNRNPDGSPKISSGVFEMRKIPGNLPPGAVEAALEMNPGATPHQLWLILQAESKKLKEEKHKADNGNDNGSNAGNDNMLVDNMLFSRAGIALATLKTEQYFLRDKFFQDRPPALAHNAALATTALLMTSVELDNERNGGPPKNAADNGAAMDARTTAAREKMKNMLALHPEVQAALIAGELKTEHKQLMIQALGYKGTPEQVERFGRHFDAAKEADISIKGMRPDPGRRPLHNLSADINTELGQPASLAAASKPEATRDPGVQNAVVADNSVSAARNKKTAFQPGV